MTTRPKRPLWLRVLLSALLVVCVLLCCGVWFFSSVMMYTKPFKCEKERFHFCGDPSEQNIPFQEVSFLSHGKTTIRGWWMPPPKQAGVLADRAIVLSHGRGADRREGMRFAGPLHKAGFGILAFDYRNCGKSQKSYNSLGYYERHDLSAAIDKALEQKGIKRIGLVGFSMGSAVGILVMAKDKRVLAGRFEGGFANGIDAAADRAHDLYGLPYFPMIPLVVALYSWRGKIDFSQIHPEDHIAKIAPRPILLVHGGKDKVVKPPHFRRLWKRAKASKTKWFLPEGRHVNSWNIARKRAETETVAFFNKAIPPIQSATLTPQRKASARQTPRKRQP